MNNQLWLTNALLLSAIAATTSYLYFVRPYIPQKNHLSVALDQAIEESNLSPVVEALLKRDLFNNMPVIEEEEVVHYIPKNLVFIPDLPQPPSPLEEKDLKIKPKELLPPLSLILKGTVLSSTPSDNRIFVESIKTKEERSARLGDIVEDAQVVFIGKNKAVFIRANGQEETLYINSASAEEEKLLSLQTPWNKIIYKDNDEIYKINLSLLSKRTPSISHFLEELDIVTAFQGVIPIGCQIGTVPKESLAFSLGLETHDIIKKINNISVATPEERINIYEEIIDQENLAEKIIFVEIMRKNQIILHKYLLIDKQYLKNNKQKNISEKKRGIALFSKPQSSSYESPSYKKKSAEKNAYHTEPYEQIAYHVATNVKETMPKGSREAALQRQVS